MRPSLLIVTLVVACGPAAAPFASPTATAAVSSAAPSATATPTRSPLPSPSSSPSPTPIPPPVATAAGTPVHYVAIGASDTVGVGAVDPSTGSWPSRIAALLPAGSTYRNLGVSGSLAAQAAREQLPAATADSPDIVTIWLAVNDLNAQVSARDLAAALTTIVDGLLTGTSARIFLGTVPDLRAVPAYASVDKTALLAAIQQYNAAIYGVAARRSDRIFVVDLYTGSAELMSDVTVAADGFHPSDDGYALIAQRFSDTMRKAGVPLR